MSKIVYAHICANAPNMIDFWPINWANINIFECNQLYMKIER